MRHHRRNRGRGALPRPTAFHLTAALLLVLASFDAAVTTPGWPYAVLLGVPALVLAALSGAGRPRRTAWAGGAVALSLTGSAALALLGHRYLGTFGLAEAGALLVLLTELWRCATRRRDWALVACAVAAPVVQALRGRQPDDLVFAALRALAAAVAVTSGTALRSADLSHRLAVAQVRRAEREDIARELRARQLVAAAGGIRSRRSPPLNDSLRARAFRVPPPRGWTG